MAEKTINNNSAKIIQSGKHDAVINGDIVHDIQSTTVFVKNEDERNRFTQISPVGTICAVYGFGTMWQLNSDREWVSM
jgi:hypothetical protein